MMAVVSPTRVAAPCRLEDTAMLMIKGTGLVLSFLQISRAMGATISTVATLSTKAEMMPANRARATAAIWTLGTFSMMRVGQEGGHFAVDEQLHQAHGAGDHQQDVEVDGPQDLVEGQHPVAIKTAAEPMAM